MLCVMFHSLLDEMGRGMHGEVLVCMSSHIRTALSMSCPQLFGYYAAALTVDIKPWGRRRMTTFSFFMVSL